MFYLFNHQF